MSADETSMGTCLCDLFENLSTNKVKPHPIVQLAGVAAVLVHRFGAVASLKKVKRHRILSHVRR